jgi:5'-nucleotidase
MKNGYTLSGKKRSLLCLLITAGIFYFTTNSQAKAQGENFSLTIIHTNDIHGRIDQFLEVGSRCTPADAAENRCVGGVARRATIIKQVRAEGGNVLLLDGGDQFQGTLFYTKYKGEEAATFMNMLGYDAMAVGNHEFDDGPANLARFIEMVNFPVLSANIDATDDPDLAGRIPPYTVVEVGGTQIGVVGITTEETSILSSPGAHVKFLNIERTVQAAVDELTVQGIQIIIAVSHAGYAREQQVARAVRGIDVIVGGHSHTLLSNTDPAALGPYPTVIKSPDGSPVLVVTDFQWGINLGRLDLTFDSQGVAQSWSGAPIHLGSSVAMDAEVQALVETFRAPLNELQQTIVGETTDLLDGDRASCRFGECTMGDFVSDAILWSTASEGVQIVIINGGSFRSSIVQGDITLGNILEVLPFSNTISTFELSGQDVIAALENGVSRAHSAINEGTGRYPQVAGLRYSWSPDKLPGERILRVEVQNADGTFTPIDPKATYKIATNDFLRRGGDGYSVFAEKAKNAYDAGANLEDVVAAYVETHSPIKPSLDGRITQEHPEANLLFSGSVLLAAILFAGAGIGLLMKRDSK